MIVNTDTCSRGVQWAGDLKVSRRPQSRMESNGGIVTNGIHGSKKDKSGKHNVE